MVGQIAEIVEDRLVREVKSLLKVPREAVKSDLRPRSPLLANARRLQKCLEQVDRDPHEPPEVDMMLAREACEVARDCAPYMHPRLASVDAKIEIDDSSRLNDAERREKARQMILEAFAERPALPNTPPLIEHEPVVDMGESMGSANNSDANQLYNNDKAE